MKKKISFLLFVIFIISLVGCGKETSDQYISKKLNLKISNAEEIQKIDTHGGFHGDGETYIVLKCNDDTVLEQIKDDKSWNTFPLDDTVEALVYGISDKKQSIGPYITDEKSGKVLVPKISQGYYCLIDRQDKEEKNILYRSSFNFTLGIYDTDTNTLYYCELDS